MAGSPTSRASSRPRASRSIAARSASGSRGRAAARAAATVRASGSRRAQAGDLIDRVGLGRGTPAKPRGKHLPGLVLAENVERQQPGALARRQARQLGCGW